MVATLTIVWLIHQAHDDLAIRRILRSQLLPQAREVIVGRTARSTNDGSVPASVIMNINYAMRACRQASLYKLVVLSKIRSIERAAKLIVDEVLPCDGQSEDVEFVV